MLVDDALRSRGSKVGIERNRSEGGKVVIWDGENVQVNTKRKWMWMREVRE